MPVVLNGSIPLPSIRVYTSVSVLLVSLCLYYAINVTSDPFWRQQSNATTAVTTGASNVNAILSGTVASEAAGVADMAAAGGVGDVAAGGGGGIGNVGVGNKLDSLMTVKEINDFEEKILAATDADLKKMMEHEAELLERSTANDSRTIGAHLKDIASFMGSEPICIWVSTSRSSNAFIILSNAVYHNSYVSNKLQKEAFFSTSDEKTEFMQFRKIVVEI